MSEATRMHELALMTAFVAGLLGSTHCLTMCGGIASALGATRAAGSRAGNALLYQCGRLASYAAAGALAGALGLAAGAGFALARWGEVLRLATAGVVILIGLDLALGAQGRLRLLRLPERVGARLWRRVAPLVTRALPASGATRAFTLGLLWGWLPCGLVYSVLLAAAVAGGAAGGSAIMLAFGVGTLPAMLSLSYAGAHIGVRDGALARLFGALIVACGLWSASMPIAMLRGAMAVHPAGDGQAATNPAGASMPGMNMPGMSMPGMDMPGMGGH
jgi:sulfite exporter TauE/SafE